MKIDDVLRNPSLPAGRSTLIFIPACLSQARWHAQ